MTKSKNAYLQKQAQIRQAFIDAAGRVSTQFTIDCVILVLNEEFGFGYDRIRRLVDAVKNKGPIYSGALQYGPEADYLQEKLDEALRRVINGKEPFYPFRERYPDLKEITYGGKLK